MRRHASTTEPSGHPRTFREFVHAGNIAWLSDTGGPAGYTIRMIAFDQAPWDRLLDKDDRRHRLPGPPQGDEAHAYMRRPWAGQTEDGEVGRRTGKAMVTAARRARPHHGRGPMVGPWPHKLGTLRALITILKSCHVICLSAEGEDLDRPADPSPFICAASAVCAAIVMETRRRTSHC